VLRFLAAVLVTYLAICLVPDGRSGSHYVREKVWLSRTCPDSKWYLDEADDQTVTVVCYSLQEDDGN
jgi:hypothetical protein